MEHCQVKGDGEADQARRRAVCEEQSYLTRLYARLDALREQARASLVEAHRQDATGFGARMDREARAAESAALLARLSAVENGLCFGRIDRRRDGEEGQEVLHIGRTGLRDEDREPLLIDWRAPAARPFYAATPSCPHGLVRRRHLHTRDRSVLDIDDEVFDLDGLSESDRATLVGEAALLAALRRGRTGRMGDIVATIQLEQDRVIRSALPGALVVQGGPGTGKTVAALHRAAYLLYTHRETLQGRGVLVVGPNPTFLRYIGQVLPSLGETEVVLSTVGELYPGVRASAGDTPDAAVAKGSLRMVGLVEAAVADRQRVPDTDLVVETQGMALRVGHETCVRLRDRARDLGLGHNVARKLFVNEMLWELARSQKAAFEDSVREAEEAAGLLEEAAVPEGEDPEAELLTEEDLAEACATLWAAAEVRAALDGLWPLLTPERLIGELLSDPALLASAAQGLAADPDHGDLTPHELRALLRPGDAPWTQHDVPLLDEAAVLLGTDDTEERARERTERERRAEEERYAQGVLEFTGLAQAGMVDVAELAERHRDEGPARSTAERAAADRTWAYGHVIVDEAQELSRMAWRMVMRRAPSRSLTVVGDLAQTGSPAGARSWEEMLGPYVHGRLYEQRLVVNYRTPAEIMAVAADVLAAVAPQQEPPRSVREGGAPPSAVRLPRAGKGDALASLVDSELEAIGEGRLAVLVPEARHDEVAAHLPRAGRGAGAEPLDSPAAVLTVAQAKGLEFDAVVLVDPTGILEQSAAGGNDLYVALTRATRRLLVVYEDALPPMLHSLRT